ncbi:RidA family protein [Brevibacillus sp. NRS-1366]|uniref:RidA family protein n=1 Tax=Brevibacillus sp. NRS-1366 TaxID=3233899 RepID=UPI003D218C9B
MKKVVQTSLAPSAIGPYSQAIELSGLIFVSGQIPLDPDTSEIVSSDIEEQTHRSIQNLIEILKAAGAGVDDVLKTTIFIKDMNDFPKVNKIYGEYFVDNPPARACVEVSRLPKDTLIEIEAIAHKK